MELVAHMVCQRSNELKFSTYHMIFWMLSVIYVQIKQTLIGCKEWQIPSYRVNQFLVLYDKKYIWNHFIIVILSALLYSCVSGIYWWSHQHPIPSLKLTVRRPKMDHWKTTAPVGEAYFQGRTVNFREGNAILNLSHQGQHPLSPKPCGRSSPIGEVNRNLMHRTPPKKWWKISHDGSMYMVYLPTNLP